MAEDAGARFEGIAMAESILIWSALCFAAPGYLAIEGTFRLILNIVGVVLGVVAVGGALISASELFKNEGFSYMGAAAVFGIPAGILYLVDRYSAWGSPWTGITRTSVLFLSFMAGPFLCISAAHFLEPGESEVTPAQRRTRRRRTIETSVVGLFGVATAALNLVEALTDT